MSSQILHPVQGKFGCSFPGTHLLRPSICFSYSVLEAFSQLLNLILMCFYHHFPGKEKKSKHLCQGFDSMAFLYQKTLPCELAFPSSSLHNHFGLVAMPHSFLDFSLKELFNGYCCLEHIIWVKFVDFYKESFRKLCRREFILSHSTGNTKIQWHYQVVWFTQV